MPIFSRKNEEAKSVIEGRFVGLINESMREHLNILFHNVERMSIKKDLSISIKDCNE